MKKLLLLLIVITGFASLGYSQTVTTNAIVTYDQTTATFTADATGLIDGTTYIVKFYYDTYSGGYSLLTQSGTYSAGLVSHTFSADITGLNTNTQYFLKAYLYVPGPPPGGDTYVTVGAEVTFTTLAVTTPTIATGTTGSVTSSTIEVIGNNISNDGGSAITAHGLKGGTTSGNANYTYTNDGGSTSAPNTFDKSANSLDAATKYYFSAFATNSTGTAYGSESSSYTEPSSGASFSSITGISNDDKTILTLNWSNGDGESGGNGGRIIVGYIDNGTVTPTTPTDGIVYSGNAAFGSGNALGDGYVMYVGNSVTTLDVTAIDGATKDYEFYIYEYAGSAAEINYLASPGFITTDGTTFPIELIRFSANSVKDRVEIDWSTATELNNDYFEIERSIDAVNFEVVVKIPGAGNSNEILDYSIIDNEKLEGTVYYRLKQTDFDGAFTYSAILPVTIGGTNELQISDVINSDKIISFVYNNDIGDKAIIHLVDINGRIVKTQEVSGTGAQLVRMAMGNLSHGVYVIRLSVKDETIIKKLVY